MKNIKKHKIELQYNILGVNIYKVDDKKGYVRIRDINQLFPIDDYKNFNRRSESKKNSITSGYNTYFNLDWIYKNIDNINFSDNDDKEKLKDIIDKIRLEILKTNNDKNNIEKINYVINAMSNKHLVNDQHLNQYVSNIIQETVLLSSKIFFDNEENNSILNRFNEYSNDLLNVINTYRNSFNELFNNFKIDLINVKSKYNDTEENNNCNENNIIENMINNTDNNETDNNDCSTENFRNIINVLLNDNKKVRCIINDIIKHECASKTYPEIYKIYKDRYNIIISENDKQDVQSLINRKVTSSIYNKFCSLYDIHNNGEGIKGFENKKVLDILLLFILNIDEKFPKPNHDYTISGTQISYKVSLIQNKEYFDKSNKEIIFNKLSLCDLSDENKEIFMKILFEELQLRNNKYVESMQKG